MDSESKTKGITCAKCGCADLRTTKTIQLPSGRVRRYKSCRYCGATTTTLEVLPRNVKA